VIHLVTFKLTNTSDGMLPLVYDIWLSQNYIRDPKKSGLVMVGAANGEVSLLPRETKTLVVKIEVTETPNGLNISVFDSRTPKFIFEILNS